MAKISLRVYNREIENLIEGGQTDEAVAHCQHILKTFSMHIETYQLLGKAFLEAHRYTDAADIFQRVLNAAPDDFVAHVGMSIIRDDEGKLDEAIWHMERAFEVQPSNPAIQGELRRLYGRRDGVEPPKIRLSRDALANMYAQGELFNQAIAEIRSVLAEDPERPDLQVMLTRAYFRVGQKVEAAEMAAQLLKKYPYCLDALRVLVEVLPGTARAENTQVYRQRLRLLDPYSSFVSGSVFTSNQVADASVNLERLEYQPGKQAGSSQPSWAASLGVKLDEDKREASHPVWLTDVQAESTAEATPPFPALEAGSSQESGAIPDFLRAAGWGQSDGQPVEESPGVGEQPPTEEIAKGEMPDWLKSQLPPGLSGTEVPGEEPVATEGADLPDWLTGLGAATMLGDAANEQPGEEPTAPVSFASLPAAEGEPDLSFLASQPPGPESALAAPLGIGETRPVDIEDDTMAWLEGLAAKQGAKPEELLTKPEERSEELPDWLKETAGEQPLAAEQTPASIPQPPEASEPIQPEEPILGSIENVPSPDLRSTLPSAEESLPVEMQPPSTPEAETTKPLGIEDDTKAWLESLAPKQDVEAEKLLAKPEERREEFPDWLTDTPEEQSLAAAQPLDPELQPVEASEPTLPEKPVLAPIENVPSPDLRSMLPSAEESLFEEMQSPSTPEATTSAPPGIEDDTMAWLEGLSTEEGASTEEMPIKSEERFEELPEWLKGTTEEEPLAAIQPPSPEPLPAEPSESRLPEKPVLEPIETKPLPNLRSTLPVPDESLAEELHPPGPREAWTTKPLGIDNETLAWLEGLGAKQGAKAEELLTKPEERSEDMPDWLQKTTQEPESNPEYRDEQEIEMPSIPLETAADEPIIPQEILAASPESPMDNALDEQPPASAEEDVTITTWLKNLDESGIPTDIPVALPGPEPSTLAQEGIPDWLKDIEKQSTLPEPAMEAATSGPETDLPDWLLQPVAVAPEQPANQLIPADSELPGLAPDDTERVEQPAPTIPEEWIPVEKTVIVPEPREEKPPVLEMAAVPTAPPARPLVPKGTGILSHIPVQDKDAILLSGAQELLKSNHLDEAMKEYGKLIRKGRLSDEVIHDLREALYRYPVDIIVWQSLGDAYMRANRLQDALDAYTKAEELLR